MMSTPSGNSPSGSDTELASFVHRWAEAIVTNDVERIAPFTTEDWILVDRPGPISRQAFHDVVASGNLRHDDMIHEVLGIDRFGAVAVIRTRGRNKAWFRGEAIEADEWTTNLLLQGPDGWRCFLTQLTPRSQPEPE
ncbi:nuclear transport factor 2 family protein [Tessaracoccus rhinocerotis]|uniref:Nuclear transport factor 2 family protein n=1 Tax=Tessaracoccus rhinocerotis TaxID=1689449 RepID=A0A553JXY5_9ACTN|nr:nuclear transport factor 2 family protein [Tessaracoccus rhinocerotis]TRY17314.1 nuclear transport factor 2 family protein [Tessaracoccus rhinocerotis]